MLALALVWLVFIAAPIYLMVIISFEPESGSLTVNPWFPSAGVTLQNYVQVFGAGFWGYLENSTIVSVGSTALAVTIGLLAAFAIVRRAGRITGLVFRLFLLGFAVPIQALMISLYIEIQHLHLYDSLVGIVLPITAFNLPITVFILTNFLRDVPRELIEAMEIDGARPLRLLRSLAIPIAMPAIATVAIFNFIMAWNNFVFPLILTESNNKATLPLAVFNFEGMHFQNVPNVMASVVLATLPLLVFYLFARRRIVSALTAGFSR